MKFILPLLIVFSLSLCAAPSSMKLETILSHLSDSDDHNGQDLTIEENINSGRMLKLSNGTIWEIAPQDTSITEIWIFPFPLEIKKSQNSTYPYYIINKRSKTKVLARPLTEKSAAEKQQQHQQESHQQQQKQQHLTPQQQQTPQPQQPHTQPQQQTPPSPEQQYPAPTPTPLGKSS